MEHSAVVRIYATTQEPNYNAPWQSETPESGTGSGVVLQSGLVLTGAHVVADATFIQVQKLSDPNKYLASVESICHDADLAVLRVTGEHFMDDVTPVEIGVLPSLRDPVSVVGYPVGGEEISVTQGVVSRVEVQRYAHSQRHLLAITVDAAINDGNSGGPVLMDGKLIGIAFQSLEDAENIGEMVPTPIIDHFLRNAKSQPYVQVPGLGLIVQTLENPVLCRSLNLSPEQSGVLVGAVQFGSSSCGKVQVGDVMLEIGGHSIANNGTVRYRELYRTAFDVLLGELAVGDSLTLSVLRDGDVIEIELSLTAAEFLVPRNSFDKCATYFVFGGIVFQTLSRDFLACWTDWWDRGPKEFLQLYYAGIISEEQQEVVVIGQVLADEINVGYENCNAESVVCVNGIRPRNMRHFVDLVGESEGVIDIRTSAEKRIVLDIDETQLAGPRILQRYNISQDRSVDLRS
ncbi:MAG: S1-C subfamily serine protease [Planctomycetota bacterium]|jgi:S1-C subfamily serine protease